MTHQRSAQTDRWPMRALSRVIVLAAVLLLGAAGCSRILSRIFEAVRGERTYVRAEIAFVAPDGTPIVDAPVYVVEQIGTMRPITEVLKTDAHGHILLDGYYCLPAEVATQGGNFVIQPPATAASYRIGVAADGPSLEQLFGRPDSRFLGYSRKHSDCG